MRRAVILAGLGVFLVGAFLGGYALSDRSPHQAARPGTIVDAVRLELSSHYYRPVSPSVLQLDSVGAMIAALHDPYTEYLDRSSFSLLQRQLADHYTGVGIKLLPSAAGLVVVGVRPGPARTAGIRTGDVIVRVGHRAASGLGWEEAAGLLAGPPGMPLRLEVRRAGRLFRVTVRPVEIQASNVMARIVIRNGHRFGYVRVLWFGHGTSSRVADAVRRFRADGVSALVLDVRGDPGGFLREGVRTASLFLRSGRIVTLVGAHAPRRNYDASARDVAARLPLAVLIDHNSASSAEVVAAALRDNRRAILVGEHTFGKAVVQTLQPLADGGALAFTTARYYTPTGADISRGGIVPDLRVRDDRRTRRDEVLDAALHALVSDHS